MQLSLCEAISRFAVNTEWDRKGYCWTKSQEEKSSLKNVLKFLMLQNRTFV